MNFPLVPTLLDAINASHWLVFASIGCLLGVIVEWVRMWARTRPLLLPGELFFGTGHYWPHPYTLPRKTEKHTAFGKRDYWERLCGLAHRAESRPTPRLRNFNATGVVFGFQNDFDAHVEYVLETRRGLLTIRARTLSLMESPFLRRSRREFAA